MPPPLAPQSGRLRTHTHWEQATAPDACLESAYTQTLRVHTASACVVDAGRTAVSHRVPYMCPTTVQPSTAHRGVGGTCDVRGASGVGANLVSGACPLSYAGAARAGLLDSSTLRCDMVSYGLDSYQISIPLHIHPTGVTCRRGEPVDTQPYSTLMLHIHPLKP